LGYESGVVATLIIAIAILLSVLIYHGASPIFIAYGVAMCGIGMLTLTGNTISMDVFGPVADNSNGIGEMGYDREEMGEENYRRADRRHRAVPVQLDADPRRRPRRVPDRQGMPRPVPRPGDLGRHQDPRLRPGGQHLHRRGAGRADRPGAARDHDADPGRHLP